MRHRLLTILGVLSALIICCILAGLFLDGYYLPSKPCRPITYPDGKRTTKEFSSKTPDSQATVLQFYNQHLGISSTSVVDTGDWKQEKLSDSKYLFSCYSVDLNGLSTESGCIYVSVSGEYIEIDGELNRSEGSNVPCLRN